MNRLYAFFNTQADVQTHNLLEFLTSEFPITKGVPVIYFSSSVSTITCSRKCFATFTSTECFTKTPFLKGSFFTFFIKGIPCSKPLGGHFLWLDSNLRDIFCNTWSFSVDPTNHCSSQYRDFLVLFRALCQVLQSLVLLWSCSSTFSRCYYLKVIFYFLIVTLSDQLYFFVVCTFIYCKLLHYNFLIIQSKLHFSSFLYPSSTEVLLYIFYINKESVQK